MTVAEIGCGWGGFAIHIAKEDRRPRRGDQRLTRAAARIAASARRRRA